MRRDKALKTEILDLHGFLGMIEAYEEISAIRMRKVKKSVLARREFMSGLNEAFAYIVYSYEEFRKVLKKKGFQNIFNSNGRNALILLSSNTGLYGDIIMKTFNYFAEDARTTTDDIIIVGKLGKRFFDQLGLSKSYQYFEISDSGGDEESIKVLTNVVINYSNATVYHPVFKSILSQDPTKTLLTGEVMEMEKKFYIQSLSGSQFLFEPSVDKIAEYFEKQILSLIFEQTLFESSLSKFASRMGSLDIAADNVHRKISSIDFDLKKAKHKRTNSDLQEKFSGGMLWM